MSELVSAVRAAVVRYSELAPVKHQHNNDENIRLREDTPPSDEHSPIPSPNQQINGHHHQPPSQPPPNHPTTTQQKPLQHQHQQNQPQHKTSSKTQQRDRRSTKQDQQTSRESINSKDQINRRFYKPLATNVDAKAKKYSVPNSTTISGTCKGYVNYGANASNKSNSLPANASLQYDPVQLEPEPDYSTHLLQPDPEIPDPNMTENKPTAEDKHVEFSLLGVPAEDLAAQITLLDLPAFAAIQPDELTSCAWNARHKMAVAPNVVAFTRRFNNVSFWTVSEILSGQTPKLRAEILTHFIRIARHLHSLNNLHALFAVISGLQSASVYRLVKTWALLTKRDRQTFDRLAEIFSEKDNWRRLREYQDSLKLPCIPYLGLFLTDFVYIDMAHPPGGVNSSVQRSRRMDNILRVIALYQQSRYDGLVSEPRTQRYLAGVRYIEELQRFLEDDQYKLSLKLEPPASNNSNSNVNNSQQFSGSGESILDSKDKPSACSTISEQTRNVASLNLSPAKQMGNCNSGSLRVATVAKFIPGHRKCRSLGTNIFYKNQLPSVMTNSDYDNSYNSRHLLDDSVLEDVNPETSGTSNGTSITHAGDGTLIKNWSLDCTSRLDWPSDQASDLEGCVRRKTILRDGRRPSVASWQRYWLQLWAGALVYFAPKTFKGSERNDFKREPCKLRPLLGWTISPPQCDIFHMTNHDTDVVYKFKVSSNREALEWFECIRRATENKLEQDPPLPANLMSFE